MTDDLAALVKKLTNPGGTGPAWNLCRKAKAAIESLAAENARLEREIGTAREVAMIRHCDVNANGKTILDFHEVWLRQANERAERAETERDAALDARDKAEHETGKAYAERDALRSKLTEIRNALECSSYHPIKNGLFAIVDAALAQEDEA